LELAERLGRTVPELLRSVSSAELTEWMALYELRADEQRAELDALQAQDAQLRAALSDGKGEPMSADEWLKRQG
jgi:hypothetical protein